MHLTKSVATPNKVFAIVCVGIVLANLDLFIVNVGFPAIGAEFPTASLEDLSWILNGYAIGYAALLVFFGRLAERYRRDRSFLVGVGLFTVASAACAASTSVAMLVVFRVVQAAGAALMTPTSIGLLLATFPPEHRGAAVRNWAAIGGFASSLGPLIGGVLIALSWRWIFIVNVPIGLVAMVIAWRELPAIAGHDVEPPNPAAALLVTLGIAALTGAIVKGGDWGWLSLRSIMLLAGAVLCLTLFVRHCLRSPNPFIDPSLFRIPAFTGATLMMVPFGIAFGAMLFSIALWEQTAWGWTALQAGLSIAPGPLLVPITSMLLAGRLLKRFGTLPVLLAGIALFAVGLMIWAIFVGAEPAPLGAEAGMGLIGIGVGLSWPTTMGVGTSSLPASLFATGSGVINMTRQAALAIGVAVFVALLALPATSLASSYQRTWWIMAAILATSAIPALVYIRPVAPPRSDG
jgi:EmrB/QacA subfamily drug resistance transporter